MASTPLSREATTTPWPVMPRSHRAGALTLETFHSATAADEAAGGAYIVASGETLATAGLRRSASITSGVAVRANPFTIQSGVKLETRPARCQAFASARNGFCDRSARARLRPITCWRRAKRVPFSPETSA